MNNNNQIQENRKYFEFRLKIANALFKKRLYEDCINYIEQTASYAWFNFSGYYKSAELEDLLHKIGNKIISGKINSNKIMSNKTLHICSEVYDEGGHTKLLYNWILNNPEDQHCILSTRLTKDKLKNISEINLGDAAKNIEHISVQSSSKIESAEKLAEYISKGYKRILLHIHPDETLTNIVLSQNWVTTPVAFINHADHVFWLGTSISDYILQIREANISIDKVRRGISENKQRFVPIPVSKKEINSDNRTNDIHILSTGTPYKYSPNETYDFLKEAEKVVYKHPSVTFHLVGMSADTPYAQQHQHERIIYHGILSVEELSKLEKKTDLYVEGFPVPSFTALIQIALRKVPFLLHYRPLDLFKLFAENPSQQIIYPKNIEEWHQMIDQLITNQNFRFETKEQQFQMVHKNNSIEAWKNKVNALYIEMNHTKHQVETKQKEIYVNGENEKLLVTIDRKRIEHYTSTKSLSIVRRVQLFIKSLHKNKNVTYMRYKEALPYILGRK